MEEMFKFAKDGARNWETRKFTFEQYLVDFDANTPPPFFFERSI